MSPKELEEAEIKILKDKTGKPLDEGKHKETPLEKLKKEHPDNKDFPDNNIALEEENDA